MKMLMEKIKQSQAHDIDRAYNLRRLETQTMYVTRIGVNRKGMIVVI